MNGFRSLIVSLAVFFAFIFCFVTSQAAAFEERVALQGPEVHPPTQCIGNVVGRTTIEKKGEDLAQQIVGAVLQKDKSDNSITVTVRFRNGPPNERFNVIWNGLATPGDCIPVTGGKFLGQMTTDADGEGRARFITTDPFPGDGVKIIACAGTGPGLSCVFGQDTAFSSLFEGVPTP